MLAPGIKKPAHGGLCFPLWLSGVAGVAGVVELIVER